MGKLFFHHVVAGKPDPIFALLREFQEDARAQKIDLSAGIYRDEKLQPVLFRAVKEAEKLLPLVPKPYLPIEGDSRYLEKMGALVFGEFLWKAKGKTIFGAQAPGGTGALRVGGEFIKQEVGGRIAYSDPTWANHKQIFTRSGLEVESYPYGDFERCKKALKGLAPGTAVLCQASCHNPTGIDFSMEEWKEISQICKAGGLLPFFDLAYQGMGEGIEEDAAAIRLFIEEGHEMMVSCTQSKNFGIYNERTGAIFFVTESEGTAKKVGSKIKPIVRGLYSNPPAHGGKLVAMVLEKPELRKMWEEELSEMRKRLQKVRKKLAEKLSLKSIAQGRGMFGMLPITQEQALQLKKEFGIYLTLDGRINLAGLHDDGVDYLVRAYEKIVV
ncbi:MAG: aspartate/tyrosine/aromatic aminotransferase [Verrucomicrobia bacterium]|nr:aspartate/tyrosine/aromatic aminotransferase [Verrucomicrobiota bacterium]